MDEFDQGATQGRPAPDADVPDVRAELGAAGFLNAEEIGRGGFGAVFRCEQPALDRTVAVKVLTAHLDPVNLERFVREQRAMGRLSGHPHIVTMMQVGTTVSGRPYIVMQYHPKGSLHERIQRRGTLDWAASLRLGVKICGALEAAHRAGTLHRDVKPGNILITDYGEPQLTDFGIARIAGGFQTSATTIAGSPGFTAPELLRGVRPTPASDVYGLGATLFCALTGHAAFERRSGEQVVAHFLRLTTQPVADLRSDGVPADVCRLIERAMAADPAERPATAAAFGEELRNAQRRLELAVDDMALPGRHRGLTSPGWERARDRNAQTSGPDANPACAGSEVLTAHADGGAGTPGSADRRAACGPIPPVDADPSAQRIRQEHARRAVARRAGQRGHQGRLADGRRGR
jgi:serine/threonine-protein kinase PknK